MATTTLACQRRPTDSLAQQHYWPIRPRHLTPSGGEHLMVTHPTIAGEVNAYSWERVPEGVL